MPDGRPGGSAPVVPIDSHHEENQDDYERQRSCLLTGEPFGRHQQDCTNRGKQQHDPRTVNPSASTPFQATKIRWGTALPARMTRTLRGLASEVPACRPIFPRRD